MINDDNGKKRASDPHWSYSFKLEPGSWTYGPLKPSDMPDAAFDAMMAEFQSFFVQEAVEMELIMLDMINSAVESKEDCAEASAMLDKVFNKNP